MEFSLKFLSVLNSLGGKERRFHSFPIIKSFQQTKHCLIVLHSLICAFNNRKLYFQCNNTFNFLPKLFPRNGPRGTYSHAWISLAVKQVLINMSSKIKTNKECGNETESSMHTTPVIHQHKPKDMICSLIYIYRLSKFVSRTNYSSLEAIQWTNNRWIRWEKS